MTACELIASLEGCRLNAYQDTKGVWTIGYGHTDDVKAGDKVTQHQAEVIFAMDLENFEVPVRKALGPKATENQVSACTSFAFNEGLSAFLGSTLLKKFKLGDVQGASDEFFHWTRAGNDPDVLRGRREKERELFLQE